MTKLQIARKYKRQIKKLEQEQDKLYRRAIKELGITVNEGHAFDYLYNDNGKEYDKLCLEKMFGEADSEALRT